MRKDHYGTAGVVVILAIMAFGFYRSVTQRALSASVPTATVAPATIAAAATATAQPIPATSLAFTAVPVGALSIGGGTYHDRQGGSIGTAFVYDPTSPTGAISSVGISGPSQWNDGNRFDCAQSIQRGMASNKVVCWVFSPPMSGNYFAQASVGGQAYSGTVSINSFDTLPPPQIRNVTPNGNQIIVSWTLTPGSQSFWVRINPVPYRGVVTDEFVVSGNTSIASLDASSLSVGQEYQAVVFALSQDVRSSNPIQPTLNMSADAQTLRFQRNTTQLPTNRVRSY